jgi:IMP dehydrogenase/GMP reductase
MRQENVNTRPARETRRRFLATVAMVGGGFATGNGMLERASALAAGQTPRGMPKPPAPAEPKDQGEAGSQMPNAEAAKRALLVQREKEFREGVERLYALTGELRAEVQKTTTTEVLSIHMYKKAEEIEKLAKQLKNKAKGG